MSPEQRFRVVLAVALALGAAGAYQALQVNAFLRTAVEATGTVVSVGSERVAGKGVPVEIRFPDGRGVEQVFVEHSQDTPGKLGNPYPIGAAVRVVYDPERGATSARIGRMRALWQWPIVLGAGCLMVLIAALIMKFGPTDDASG